MRFRSSCFVLSAMLATAAAVSGCGQNSLGDPTGSTCPPGRHMPASGATTATFIVQVPSSAPKVGYRFNATTTAVTRHGPITVQNSADVIVPCGVGDTCEAETGDLTGGACFASDHPDYTGTGFVACLTNAGPGVTQRFAVPAAGTYTFDVRYAAGPNGPASTRTATITVDGAPQGQLQLPRTGSWNTWGDATVTLQLPAGPHTIGVSVGAMAEPCYPPPLRSVFEPPKHA